MLAREAEVLNEKYLHFMNTGRPFVHLKIGASLDGKIATRTGESRWITGPESRARAHELRHEYDAIVVGAGTAHADDPLLTDRSGKKRRLPLVRVVLDEALGLSPESRLVKTAKETPLLVFAGNSAAAKKDGLEKLGVKIARDAANGRDLELVLDELGSRNITSLLVEGGAGVAGKFLDAGLVNKSPSLSRPQLSVAAKRRPRLVARAPRPWRKRLIFRMLKLLLEDETLSLPDIRGAALKDEG